MAQLRGETPARGWQHEQAIVLGKGKGNTRIHDTARTNEQGGREFTEYKYGMRVRADAKTLNQLILDREVLTRDQNATGTWVMRAGAADATLRQQLDALHPDFPGRFQVVEISREEAEKARKLGRSLEQQAQGVQRELHDVPQLIRSQQQRARENKTRVAGSRCPRGSPSGSGEDGGKSSPASVGPPTARPRATTGQISAGGGASPGGSHATSSAGARGTDGP
ncbi:hypothetical protein IU500_31740 [Nocardia terpenica]|uniref:hypothetical protein n=1 Tax=Nocardia terpenica TaxID=455432 RepID=UPI001895377C|nr:hypothetical protein [Nocardia terpenica]MBF6066278.1 hypothetical protein [Nocardia terpenica]MBF6108592.1 hypothetical protein [Nocardia terpenica]MBF6116138.1 hypothetical protein [Nocardia terpenica]MBF6123741.1 hypothetical protein [Nocardia terpenica]MBF6157112.1 hypothetical protein [Nocardia terpenica]